jgi:glutathione S-transferase
MTYRLAIGERTYSSWSLRGWLLFAAFDIPVEVVEVPLDSPDFEQGLAPFAPARTVPALAIEGGGVVWDTLAIAMTLAERHPEVAFWPEGRAARGLARAMVAEMHAGFAALRGACPMNLRTAFEYSPSDAVRADLARLEALWAAAPGGAGPWLFGRYTVADAFFAPVAARIAGYGLPVGGRAAAYAESHLAHPAFLAWRREGLANSRRLAHDEVGLPERPWPAPA